MEKIQGLFIPYVHAYLDDLLAMPVILGITLQVFRWIHPQKSLFVFTKTQVIVGVIYISLIFEVFLPYLSDRYTRDLWDVLCYFIGAGLFYRFINIPSKTIAYSKNKSVS
ncbi:magnesium citrate secondary transporter [Pararhodonellum marinum]|uniref:magnesium citrate secondary transporter n=1 Tax=Pararhodonellum marinum TaxID=2755358 RepID=UPI001E360551|nr:magnesium citrate secondary transporter [Pararhodonellum marinum]